MAGPAHFSVGGALAHAHPLLRALSPRSCGTCDGAPTVAYGLRQASSCPLAPPGPYPLEAPGGPLAAASGQLRKG